jgi:hypothetical protein
MACQQGRQNVTGVTLSGMRRMLGEGSLRIAAEMLSAQSSAAGLRLDGALSMTRLQFCLGQTTTAGSTFSKALP